MNALTYLHCTSLDSARQSTLEFFTLLNFVNVIFFLSLGLILCIISSCILALFLKMLDNQ